MRRLLLLIAALSSSVVWAQPPVDVGESKPLYFALELKKDGRVVGTPKLLGMEGKSLRVEKRKPNADAYDYRVVLHPTVVGDRYDIALDLAVPGMQCHYDLQLNHGQVQKFAVGPKQAPLEVELTLLRVDSPEFRALMALDAPVSAKKSI